MGGFAAAHTALDAFVLALAGPVTVYILISGADDLFVDAVWIVSRFFRRQPPPAATDRAEKRIAIMIPAWHESEVIQQMLEHNSAAIHYDNYVFFVGIYPNDPLTLSAVEIAARKFSNVHWATVPHPGPTSKGDCLNWIYQALLVQEQESGKPFDLVLMHDAEDMIHPESLHYINRHSDACGFIQVPVLALETPLANLTHGIYCDEFAEVQTRDLPVRQMLGAFIPSAGVGTAVTREALDKLAMRHQNRVFEPDSLTEDYELGLRLHESGCKQMFLPVQVHEDTFVATREFFPTDWHTAVRQRTRWITGISLQTWQRHGWKGDWMRRYWFWRDRKSLLGNPVSLLASLLFVYGLCTGLWPAAGRLVQLLMQATLPLLFWRMAFRVACTSRIYGPTLAYLAPVRSLWGNTVNGVATVRAVYRYTRSRILRERLAWMKTEHQYPSRETLLVERRRIGDLLVKAGTATRAQIEAANDCRPAGVRLGEHLLELGGITEEALYQALSLQQQIPLADIIGPVVPTRVGRALPMQLMREKNLLPFRLEPDGLAVCGPEAPDAATLQLVATFTRLSVHYYLLAPSRFRALWDRSLGV